MVVEDYRLLITEDRLTIHSPTPISTFHSPHNPSQHNPTHAEYRTQNESKVAEEVSKQSAEVQQRADFRVSEIRELQRAMEKQMAMSMAAMREAQNAADR